MSLYEKNKLAEDAHLYSAGEGFKAFSLAYNTESKEEVDLIFNELKIKGVKIVKKPEKVSQGGYSGYVSDIDDNPWEIAYNAYFNFEE